MTFSDTAMMELGITQPTNIHNTRSLIRTLKYVLDILQTEEPFTVEEYKHTHTRACSHTHTYTHTPPPPPPMRVDVPGEPLGSG